MGISVMDFKNKTFETEGCKLCWTHCTLLATVEVTESPNKKGVFKFRSNITDVKYNMYIYSRDEKDKFMLRAADNNNNNN
jgi:hypothetical protein